MLSLVALLALADRSDWPLPGRVVPDGLGLNLHDRGPSKKDLDSIWDAGIRIVRTDLTWADVERRPGEYDFLQFDEFMNRLGMRGIRPLLILDYGNPNYGQGPPVAGAYRAAFLRYVRVAVERYRGRGVMWEIWNEPDSQKFWQAPPDPEAYTSLALDVAQTIRRAAPTERILGPAASAFDWSWLRRALDAGLLNAVDAITVHPYRETAPETVAADYRRLRALLNWKRPGTPPPILAGEWGYSVGYQVPDESVQAQAITRLYLTNLACGIPVTVLYQWQDAPWESDARLRGYGLVLANRTPKMAYRALKALVEQLKGATCEGWASTAQPAVRAVRFVRGGRRLQAVWTDGATLSLRIGADNVVVGPMPVVVAP